jgi:formylglycine-generating enzyme required for sulfatase activity/DNA-binding winged helix-turn-helix (wHTH) protein
MASDPFRPPLHYRFDHFEFRERTGELWRNGEGIRLPDQAGLVLLALLRAQGDMVTREELKQLLWPGKLSGDFEGGLHAAVRKLRRSLEDDGSEPRLIGTLPRRGYRMLVPVEAAAEPPRSQEAGPPAQDAVPLTEAGTTGTWASKVRSAWVLAPLLALAGTTALLWRPWAKGSKMIVLHGGAELEMAYLPPGEFAMGFDSGFKASEPVHRVTLTRGFWMGRTEVTQAQWRAVMGNDPSFFQGDDKPAEQVSWEDCQTFLARLNQQTPDLVFRLPTEAEWEYAARAAQVVGRYDDSDSVAWHQANSQGQTHPVGTKTANAWGLFDMVGNVWEWCADGFGPYLPYPQTDPQGPASELRSVRGGSCLSPGNLKAVPRKLADRVTLRYGYPADYAAKDLGFRIVAVPRT